MHWLKGRCNNVLESMRINQTENAILGMIFSEADFPITVQCDSEGGGAPA